MRANHYLIAILVGIIGFAGGFLLANKLNRSEFERLRAESDSSKKTASSASEFDLSDEEIDAKLKEAADTPNDVQFQKQLGVSLYRFGTMKRNAPIIEKALVPLKRASQLDPRQRIFRYWLLHQRKWIVREGPGILRSTVEGPAGRRGNAYRPRIDIFPCRSSGP